MKRILAVAVAVLSLTGCASAGVLAAGLAPLAGVGLARLLSWDWRPPPSWEDVRASCRSPAVAADAAARAWCAKVLAPPPEPGGAPANFGVRP